MHSDVRNERRVEGQLSKVLLNYYLYEGDYYPL